MIGDRMKKVILSIMLLSSGLVMAQTSSTLDYSLDTQRNIQRLKESEGYKGFCKEYLDKIPSTDKLGVDVIQSTCISDYFNYNSINDWGEEIYAIAMSNNKKPALYKNALPVGRLDKELFLATNVLLSSIFWTSIDRYNVKVKSIPEKETVTKEQYEFFNDLYKKLKDSNGVNLKPVMVKIFDMKKYDVKELRKSPTFVHYAESMVQNSQFKNRGFQNMDIVMSSFENYKSYLDFVYSRKMDEVVENPKKFNGYKFNKVQCATFNLSLNLKDFTELQKNSGFKCE